MRETDELAVDAGTPDTHGVVEPVGEGDMLGTDFKTATLRLVMVALDTPASLASQE